jgi:hypothetical protein
MVVSVVIVLIAAANYAWRSRRQSASPPTDDSGRN